MTVFCKTHIHFTVLSAILGDVSIGLFDILHLPARVPKALSTTNLFDYVMDSRNSESEGIYQSCITRTR
jgi:hypothetical protein